MYILMLRWKDSQSVACAVLFKKLLYGAKFNERSIDHYCHFIAVLLSIVEALGHYQGSGPRLFKVLIEFSAAEGIKPTRRFIEQDKSWAVQESDRDLKLSLAASTEPLCLGVLEIMKIEEIKHLIDSNLQVIDRLKTAIELKVLEDCVAWPEDVIVLKDDSNSINCCEIVNALAPILNNTRCSPQVHSKNID